MKKWAVLTDDLKFCEITFDGEWYRVRITDEFGQELMKNESISLQGAKKQVKRFVGTGQTLKWQEIEVDKIETPSRLHLPFGYLSVSQVRKYLTCPRAYEFKYVNKLNEPIGSSLVMGRAFHKGMQMASIKKVVDGEILSTDDVLDIYSDAFDQERENNDVDWADDDPGKVKDDGSQLMKKYYEEMGINAIPMVDDRGLPLVEREHEFEIVPGLKAKAVIDIIEQDGSIRDYKTSKRSPSQTIIDETIQMPVYALAYRNITGQTEKTVGLDYAVNLKKEKKIVRLETDGPVDDGRIDRVKQTFVGVAKAISAGIFYPNEESNACGYCSFKDICKKSKTF